MCRLCWFFGGLVGLVGFVGFGWGQLAPPVERVFEALDEEAGAGAFGVEAPLRPPVEGGESEGGSGGGGLMNVPLREGTLVFDALVKDVFPEAGVEEGELFFEVRNVSDQVVTILQLHPSCGCTLVDDLVLPWRFLPGEGDRINLRISLKGKRGLLRKFLTVYSSEGRQVLEFRVHLPDVVAHGVMGMGERLANMRVAAKDRQAIFRGDCRSCHYDAALGKEGEGLFVAACGICHDSPNRASMVPDLAVGKEGVRRDAAYWHLWIAHGKAGTLMPAFHQGQGGPLTNGQIAGLASYLAGRFGDGGGVSGAGGGAGLSGGGR